MSTKIYRGRFRSADNVEWDVWIREILDDGSSTVKEVAEPLRFEEPGAELEWPETAKEDVIHGATCRLTLSSLRDRQHAHFYTARPGSVLLHLYRDGVFYWQGTLDPEQYEEPYERSTDYPVELTFSDLGILDRLDFDLEPGSTATVRHLVKTAYSRAGLRPSGADGTVTDACVTAMHSMKRTNGEYLDPSQIEVSTDNFYDEDGNPMTWRDVLEGVLRPLGLHLVGLGERLALYDFEALRGGAKVRPIRWATDSQTLGVDRVYNRFRMTFSPYGDAQVAEGRVDEAAVRDNVENWLFIKASNNAAEKLDGFDLTLSSVKAGSTSIYLALGEAKYYAIDRKLSGDDGAGVAAYVGGYSGIHGVTYAGHRNSSGKYDQIQSMFLLPIVRLRGGGNNLLRINLDMLLDCRYNPFEDDSSAKSFQNRYWTHVYVPILIQFRTDNGQWYHYHNDSLHNSDLCWANPDTPNEYSYRPGGGSTHRPVSGWSGWLEGLGDWGEAWLAYYGDDKRTEHGPCQGWATNRQLFGRTYFGPIPSWWSKRGKGQFITLPPTRESGTLYVQVGTGIETLYFGNPSKPMVWCRKPDGNNLDEALASNPTFYENVNWLLYRNASVELTDGYGRKLDFEDIEYSAELIASAAEELSVDTTCGTAVEGVGATARGIYLDNQTGATLDKFVRGTVTATAERHLLVEMASQYSSRHTVLRGEAEAAPRDRLYLHSDAAQPAGRLFWCAGSSLNCYIGHGEHTYIELTPPQYKPI